jgi:hypothetical protein
LQQLAGMVLGCCVSPRMVKGRWVTIEWTILPLGQLALLAMIAAGIALALVVRTMLLRFEWMAKCHSNPVACARDG